MQQGDRYNERKNKQKNFGAWFRDNWKNNALFSTGIALIVMVILQTLALGFNYASFGEWFGAWINNWMNILRNNSSVGIIALGMTFVIISGGIDLAVGSTLVAVGAITMTLIGAQTAAGSARSALPAHLHSCHSDLRRGRHHFRRPQRPHGHCGQDSAVYRNARCHEDPAQRDAAVHAVQFAEGSDGFRQIARVKVGGQMFMPILYWLLIALVLYVNYYLLYYYMYMYIYTSAMSNIFLLLEAR